MAADNGNAARVLEEVQNCGLQTGKSDDGIFDLQGQPIGLKMKALCLYATLYQKSHRFSEKSARRRDTVRKL